MKIWSWRSNFLQKSTNHKSSCVLRHISGPREMWRARDRVLTLLTYPPIKCYLRKVFLQSRFNPISQPEIIIYTRGYFCLLLGGMYSEFQ